MFQLYQPIDFMHFDVPDWLNNVMFYFGLFCVIMGQTANAQQMPYYDDDNKMFNMLKIWKVGKVITFEQYFKPPYYEATPRYYLFSLCRKPKTTGQIFSLIFLSGRYDLGRLIFVTTFCVGSYVTAWFTDLRLQTWYPKYKEVYVKRVKNLILPDPAGFKHFFPPKEEKKAN